MLTWACSPAFCAVAGSLDFDKLPYLTLNGSDVPLLEGETTLGRRRGMRCSTAS